MSYSFEHRGESKADIDLLRLLSGHSIKSLRSQEAILKLTLSCHGHFSKHRISRNLFIW